MLKKAKSCEVLEEIKSICIEEYALDGNVLEGTLSELPVSSYTPRWRGALIPAYQCRCAWSQRQQRELLDDLRLLTGCAGAATILGTLKLIEPV
ncbi:hypothetical protein Y025_4067 [Burkholderia pseudomallei TSV32]|nr:hypothetical protein Y025_4067 [Burkholderia pseudomallei TSV32]